MTHTVEGRWEEIFGNLVSANEIQAAAKLRGISIAELLAEDYQDMCSDSTPGSGYERDRYSDEDWQVYADQIEREAEEVSLAARALGRRGGLRTSPAKTAASRANGRKGGRPRKSAI